MQPRDLTNLFEHISGSAQYRQVGRPLALPPPGFLVPLEAALDRLGLASTLRPSVPARSTLGTAAAPWPLTPAVILAVELAMRWPRP